MVGGLADVPRDRAARTAAKAAPAHRRPGRFSQGTRPYRSHRDPHRGTGGKRDPQRRRDARAPQPRTAHHRAGGRGESPHRRTRPREEAPARPFAKPAFSQRIEAPPDPGITIRHGPPPRLRWLAGDETQLLDITPAQEDALLHNLSAIAGQAITIRTITGNAFVRKRAESLKAVFERAGWTVSGVGEIPRTHAEPGLTLAVGTLPVEKEAAATYLALKAAGFAPVPVLDPALATGGENEAAPLTLTLAPAKAA